MPRSTIIGYEQKCSPPTVPTMTRLHAALTDMYSHYVGTNADPEGFLSDLAILLSQDEDLAFDIENELQEARDLD